MRKDYLAPLFGAIALACALMLWPVEPANAVQLPPRAARIVVPNGWYADATPKGEYAVSLLSGGVITDKGTVSAPAPNDGLLYLRIARDGTRFAGQSHAGLGSWEWNGTAWRNDTNVAYGVSGLIYNAADVLTFSGPQFGSQGFRYIEDGTGRLVTGDETYADASRRIGEYTTHGDITVGQSGFDCIAIRGSERRVLVSGECNFPRFNRDGDHLAIAAAQFHAHQAVLLFFDVSDLNTFPLQPSETPAPTPAPLPGPVFPVPVPPVPPTPAPAPVAQLTPFELTNAHILGGSPDVRSWPVTTTISQVRFEQDGIGLTFGKQTPPNTPGPRVGDWPEGPDAGAGAFQYTLWLGMGVGGQSYAVGVIEFWAGRPTTGGGPLDPNGIPGNFTYFAPPMDVQPQPGQPVSFFVTQGDARRKDAHLLAERSNVVTVAWPSAVGAVFDFGGGTPTPPQPTPTPQPAPGPSVDPQIAVLQGEVVRLQGALATATAERDALGSQLQAAQAEIARLQALPPQLGSCRLHENGLAVRLGLRASCEVVR